MTHSTASTTNNLKLYINGVLHDYENVTGYTPSAQSLSIGRESSYDYFYFRGKIDEVRYYNAAMPSSWVKEQYYAGLNSLLFGGGISESEYASRMLDFNSGYAKR